jgi:hypothetical protein
MKMSTDQLIETIVIRPTVTLIPTNQHTGLTSEYSFKPLSNLIYMRDQQITTAKGIVMGHLKTPQRHLETEVMHFAFSKLGEALTWWLPTNLMAADVCSTAHSGRRDATYSCHACGLLFKPATAACRGVCTANAIGRHHSCFSQLSEGFHSYARSHVSALIGGGL